MHVLVADDDKDVRLLYRLTLEAAGMRVTEAADGEEAIRRAIADPPDVALLDLSMPLRDGWLVASDLRGNATTERVGLVFLSGLSGDIAREKAREFDAVYLAKPIQLAHLPTIVTTAARRAAHGR